MYRDFDDSRTDAMLDAIYDAAVSPGGWRPVLDQLGTLFNCHFTDLFARTHDWTLFRGIAVGLDRADYEDEFLDTWCKRNVWSKAKPVRVAGEVLATWQMVDTQTVLRSEIYQHYLRPRGLNEGLRLSLWADEDWIQDISLLRPWSSGPFGPGEIALGRFLLPHLQRAASLSRRLAGTAGLAALEALHRPAILLDRNGRPIRINAAADALLARMQPLVLHGGQVRAVCPADQAMFSTAVAAACASRVPRASMLRSRGTHPNGDIRLDIVPVRDGGEWALPGPRAALVIATAAPAQDQSFHADVAMHFALTPAETDLALALLSGQSPVQISARSGRSIHTVRSHIARVLAKTQTKRQGELVSLLSKLGQERDRRDDSVMRMLRAGA